MLSICVARRPGVEDFLRRASELYEVVLFTASTSRYADAIVDRIDPERLIAHRLYREQCTLVGKGFVKDLALLGRELKDVVIVDNTPLSYALQPSNALPIDTWIDDKKDKQLYNLLEILKYLANVKDVRHYLKDITKYNGDHKSAMKVLKKNLELAKPSKSKTNRKSETTPIECKQRSTASQQEALKASLEAAIHKSAALRSEIEKLKSKMGIVLNTQGSGASPSKKHLESADTKQIKAVKEKNKTPGRKHRGGQELSAEKSHRPKRRGEQLSGVRLCSDGLQKSKEDLLSQLNYLKSRLSCSECDSASTLKTNPVFENKAKYKFARNNSKVSSPKVKNKDLKEVHNDYKGVILKRNDHNYYKKYEKQSDQSEAKVNAPEERYNKSTLDTVEDKSHPKYSNMQPARHERRPRTISSEYDSKGKEEPAKVLERFETYDWFAEHKPDILLGTPLKEHFANSRRTPYTYSNHVQSTPHVGKPSAAKRLAAAYPATELKESWNKGYAYL